MEEGNFAKKKSFEAILLRLTVLFGCPIIIISAVLYLYKYGSPLFCPIFRLTKFYCPGCGGGRAAADLVHGDVAAALRHNPLTFLLFPFIAYYFVEKYTKLLFRKNKIKAIIVPAGIHKLLLYIIIIFTVIRNIRLYPFTILAP